MSAPRHAVYASDPRQPRDRLLVRLQTREEAREMVRRLNALVIEEHGIPEVGSPVVLYYTVELGREA